MIMMTAGMSEDRMEEDRWLLDRRPAEMKAIEKR